MIAQLLKKELAAHSKVAVGVLAAVFAQYLLVMQFITRDEAPTLLRAATAFTWGAGPILAAFTARRLFVLEQEQGTVQFLRALPISPTALVAAKLTLGLAANLAVHLALLWATAYLRRDAEIFTVDWLVRLSAQIAAYVFAWYALACLMAQLGGYRYGAWLLLLFLLLGLDDVVHEPARNLFWTAPLADDIETTRYRTPWDAVALGLVWGSAALAGTFALARHRGGSLVDAWFRPLSAKRSAQVTGAVFFGLLALELVGAAAKPERGLVEPARAGRFTVASPTLEPVARLADAALARLEAEHGVTGLPQVLLRVRHDDAPQLALTRPAGAAGLVIGLRAGAPPEVLAREVVVDVLMGRSGGVFEMVPELGLWSVGLGAYLMEAPRLSATAGRLRDVPAGALEDYDAVLVAHGRRGAQAAGWMAWRVLAELGGPEAVRALVSAMFGAPRSRSGGGLVAARALSARSVIEDAGVDWLELVARWQAGLRAASARPGLEVDLPPPRLEAPFDAAPRLVWAPLPPALEGRAELWWSAARDLEPHPVPQGRRYVSRALDRGWATLWLDPRRRIVTTWVLDGEVLGWSEVVRR